MSVAAGYEYQDSKLGLRVYELSPGEQSGLSYHYHDEQVEAFYVLDGTLYVETPNEEFVVDSDQALFVDPGSPQEHTTLILRDTRPCSRYWSTIRR
ncbi:cupin domain-containing protein [Halalkalicoccus salilacus]|uniref:cupin domain-containing protein n=1 Tax=Halalkalicoccus TaxID=332246 RepID=UPI002F968560